MSGYPCGSAFRALGGNLVITVDIFHLKSANERIFQENACGRFQSQCDLIYCGQRENCNAFIFQGILIKIGI